MYGLGRSARVKAKIKQINFNPFLDKAKELFGLAESEFDTAVREYSHFLYLAYWNKRLENNIMVVPTKTADTLWHAHILHTQAYTNTCNDIFGHYLHHNPGLKEGTVPFEVAVKHTKRHHDFVYHKKNRPGFDDNYFDFVIIDESRRRPSSHSDSGGGDVMFQTDTDNDSQPSLFAGHGGGFGGGGADANFTVDSSSPPPGDCSSCSGCGGGD